MGGDVPSLHTGKGFIRHVELCSNNGGNCPSWHDDGKLALLGSALTKVISKKHQVMLYYCINDVSFAPKNLVRSHFFKCVVLSYIIYILRIYTHAHH